MAKFCYKPSVGEKEEREKLEVDGVVLQPKEGKGELKLKHWPRDCGEAEVET